MIPYYKVRLCDHRKCKELDHHVCDWTDMVRHVRQFNAEDAHAEAARWRSHNQSARVIRVIPKKRAKSAQCIIGQHCAKHDFVHGAEAAELRFRLEAGDNPKRILDETDVKDSLAYRESKEPKPAETVADHKVDWAKYPSIMAQKRAASEALIGKKVEVEASGMVTISVVELSLQIDAAVGAALRKAKAKHDKDLERAVEQERTKIASYAEKKGSKWLSFQIQQQRHWKPEPGDI